MIMAIAVEELLALAIPPPEMVLHRPDSGGFGRRAEADLRLVHMVRRGHAVVVRHEIADLVGQRFRSDHPIGLSVGGQIGRAHSELQSLMRISYAVFCLKKKKTDDSNRVTDLTPLHKPT